MFDWIKEVIAPVTGLVDDLFTSDEEKSEAKRKLKEVESALQLKAMEYDAQIADYKSKVIIAEAQGESPLQRSWRPITMLVFVGIVANNYILAPYLGAMFNFSIMLDIPEPMWEILQLGIGGYVAGRTIEKGLKTWKGK